MYKVTIYEWGMTPSDVEYYCSANCYGFGPWPWEDREDLEPEDGEVKCEICGTVFYEES